MKLSMIVTLLLVQNFCTAQSLNFQSYTTANGLSQNSIYSIAQTGDGFMWFGTQDGLNRFDGKNFTNISIRDSKAIFKYSKMVTALLYDRNDWLWVGTTQEILLYNRYTNQFEQPGSAFKNFILPGRINVTQVIQDNSNNIWITTQKNGIFCYSKKLQKMVPLTWNDNVNHNIVSMTCGNDGIVWACDEKVVLKLNVQDFVFKLFKTNQPITGGIQNICTINNELWLITKTPDIIILRPTVNGIYSLHYFSKEFSGGRYLSDAKIIHQSNKNTSWIGSRSEGLIKVDLNTKKFQNAGALDYGFSLKSQFVLSFFTNNQNITWVGLSGSLAKYDEQKVQFSLWRNEPTAGSKIPDNKLLSVFSENEKDFYMGTLYGGLMHTNIASSTFKYYYPPTSGSNLGDEKNMYEIINGGENLLWVAAKAGLFSFNKITKKFNQYKDTADTKTIELCSLIKLKGTNTLLVGGYNSGIVNFDIDKKKWQQVKDPHHILDSIKFRIRYMKEMEDGNVYISTETNNFICYNYFTGEFTFYPQFQTISGTSRHFTQDSSNLWIASDDGLIQASASTKRIIKVWTTQDGLTNNFIYAVLPDKFGRLWISSNGGLSLLDYKTGICKNFSVNDGLQDLEFNTASCYKGKDGKLWFGGVNGLNMVNPVASYYNAYAPKPLIIAISVMNEPYIVDTATPYLHSIALPFSKNFIGFEFQSPDFSQSENIIYEYKLDGVDTGWVKNGTKNYATYTQLKPGHYTFLVRSANSNFVWSKTPTTLLITIVPPWYKTWWFYALFISITSLVAFLFVRQRINNIRNQAALKNKITETEMAALKAQMNPHFMFNCINSIDSFIQTNDKYNATLYLNKFAKLIRNVLDSSRQNVVPFSKDIDTLKLYIELEELRSENKFSVQMRVDDELLNIDYKIPPLIVQPFVENAIIHGLRNKPDNNGVLQITIGNTEQYIVYTITDNGIGRRAAEAINTGKEKSYGLEMSYDRIKLFNKETAPSVFINDLFIDGKAAGTRVIMKLKKI